MIWRRWLVRGLVFSLLGAFAAGGWLFLAYTDPAYVRQLVQERLGVRFHRVSVSLDSARMRLLGGVLAHELRLCRSDSLLRDAFLYVPSATFLHDKEHLLDGKMLIRRVELSRPQLRIVRSRDGALNIDGILAPSAPSTERLPTVLIRGGSITIEDQLVAPGVSLLELHEVSLTLINDPPNVLEAEGQGRSDVLGPVRFKATMPREGGALTARLELPEIPVGPALIGRLALAVPEAGRHLDRLTGKASAQADLSYDPARAQPFLCTTAVQVRDGVFQHPVLPGRVEQIEADLVTDGLSVPEARVRGRWGEARLSAQVRSLPLPTTRAELESLGEAMASLEVTAERVPIDSALVARLPERLRAVFADFSPHGPATARYTFHREGHKKRREAVLTALGMQASFSGFPYQVSHVTGAVTARGLGESAMNLEADLTAYAGSRPVRVQGHIRGREADPEVAIDVRGEDIPLDQKLFDALGRGSLAQDAARKFLSEEARLGGLAKHPMGRADVHAAIRRRPGARQMDNVIRVGFKDTTVLHDDFPYALKEVSGTLILHPSHWEAVGFKGRHGDGEIAVSGRSYQVAGRPALGEGPREMVRLAVTGSNIRLDEDFEKALAPVKPVAATEGPVDRRALQRAWRGLALKGSLRFAAEVIDEPGKPLSLEFALGFNDCSMKPAFFPYPLADVTGEVRYARGQVSILGMQARHGKTAVTLRSGSIVPRADGHLHVFLNGLSAQGVQAEADLLGALPEGLRRALEVVKPSPSFDAGANLVLDVTQGAAPSARVWWDGSIALTSATLNAGAEITGATGRLHTRGHFDGRQLAGVEGQIALASATVLGQPVTDISARMEADARAPDTIRFRNIKGALFGGSVGGEALVVTGQTPRFDLALEAAGVRLEQAGKHNLGPTGSAGLEGPLRFDLRLGGEGGDLTTLRGSGRVDVADGKMGQLPIVLDLFKALGLRKPDGTAFEQLHMEYGIDGQRLLVQVLDLKGQSVSLRGAGSMGLDGSNVRIDFTAMPGLIGGWLPPPLDRIPGLFSKQLLKITMRGDLGKGLHLDKELVPALRGVVRP
jgi:hypothetical protein